MECKQQTETTTTSTVVLVPPSFGVGPADNLPLTLSAQDALQASSFFPVLWNYIKVSDPSYRLLNDHMQSGFWFHTTTSSSPPFGVSASMVLDSFNGVGSVGRVVAETQVHPYWHAQVRGGTDDDGPSLVVTHESMVPGLVFKGATNTQGDAWLSSILLYSQTNLDVRAVAWLPLEFRNKQTVHEVLANVPHVTVFGAARWGPMTGAVESQIPSNADLPPENKYYWTCSIENPSVANNTANNTSNSNSTTTTNSNNNNNNTTGGPPLQLTLQKTNEYATLALSQIFTFDRLQFNPMESRSAWVRNTVGWTVAMEKAYNNIKNNNDAGADLPPQVAVAGAWQINRAIALKAVVRPQQQQMTMALLLKRWNQPRITLTLLGRHDWSKGQTGLLGLALELETDRDSEVSYQDTSIHSFANHGPPPETRAV